MNNILIRSALALTLLPMIAVAAPSVAVVATDKCDQPTVLNHAKGYRQALETKLGAELLSEADTIARLGGASRSSPGEVERLIAAATTDIFEGGQSARAVTALTGVLDDIARLPPSPARYAAHVKALSLIGHVQLKGPNGEVAATPTFERLLRTDPKFTPDADLFPPATRNFVAKLRTKAEKKSARVALSVSTKPAGQTVYVDTKPIGPSPQTLFLPANGTYAVDVDWSEGKRGLTRIVKLDEAAASVELDKAFDGSVFPDKVCVRTDGTRKGRLAIAARLTSLLGVQTVHAIREEEPADQERFVTAVTLSASGEERVEGRVKLYAGALTPVAWDSFVAFMLTGEKPLPPVEALQGPGVVAKADAPVESAPPESVVISTAPKSGGKGLRTAGIVTLAVGVVGVATAAYFGAQAGSANSQLSTLCPNGICTPVSGGNVDQLEQSRSFNSTMTVAMGAVGGALVVTSIVLFIASSGSSSDASSALTVTPTGVAVKF